MNYNSFGEISFREIPLVAHRMLVIKLRDIEGIR